MAQGATLGNINIKSVGNNAVTTTVPVSGTIAAVTAITNPLPTGANVIGHVIADTGSTTAVTQPTGTNLHAVIDTGSTTAVTQATGTNLHTVVDSGTITAVTAITNALPAGTNLLGKVGIDQTTPGTTNLVALTAETTKAIGVTRTADGSGNLITSTTNALDVNIKTPATLPVSLATAPSTPTTQVDTSATGTISATDALGGTPAGTGALISVAPTANSFVAIALPGGSSNIDIMFTGTATGTYYFEYSMDSTTGSDGSWVTGNFRQSGVLNTVLTSGATANGIYRGNAAGFKYARIRNVGGTTPSNPVTIRVTNGGGTSFLNASLPAGSNVIGKASIDQTTPGTTNLVALTAETTKVIGTVNMAASQSIGVTQATGTNLHAVIDTGSTTAVTQATGTNLHTVIDSGTISGGKTNNNAAPGATNVGALVGVSTASAPSYTEGNQVGLSTDLSGNLRTSTSITPASDVVTTASLVAVGQARTATLNGAATTTVYISGTWVGTVQFEATTDGTTYYAVNAVPVISGTAVTSTTANGQWIISSGGYANIQARVSAYTSGTVVIALRTSIAASGVEVTSPLPTGANVIGALTANQSINSAQVNGVALSTGTGVMGTGVQRVAIASDNDALTVKQATGTNLHVVVDTTSTTAVTQATGTNLHAVIDSGSVTAVDSTASSTTIAQVASSATTTTLKALNASRKMLIIVNDSTQILYVKMGATASTTSYSFKLSAGETLELPRPMYTGVVDGIWATANGNAYVTEY